MSVADGAICRERDLTGEVVQLSVSKSKGARRPSNSIELRNIRYIRNDGYIMMIFTTF